MVWLTVSRIGVPIMTLNGKCQLRNPGGLFTLPDIICSDRRMRGIGQYHMKMCILPTAVSSTQSEIVHCHG